MNLNLKNKNFNKNLKKINLMKKEKSKKLPKIAVSIGDINGISAQLLFQSHNTFCKFCKPYYFVHKELLEQAFKKLSNVKRLESINLVEFEDDKNKLFIKNAELLRNLSFAKEVKISKFKYTLNLNFEKDFKIKAGQIDMLSGAYSFASFKAATFFVKECHAHALNTLPIHKKAWQLANIDFKGHTQALSAFFNKEAIMMLGCKELFVALFTEHIALKEVSSKIKLSNLSEFLISFYENTHFKNIALLGFNPHASDYGTIGGAEECIMKESIKIANLYLNFTKLKAEIKKEFLKENELNLAQIRTHLYQDKKLLKRLESFFEKKSLKLAYIYQNEILVADSAFTKASLKRTNRLVSMYHDLALAPLKALFFEKSVNISLNLPIIRTSVDHGTAFDKAYKGLKISNESFKQACKIASSLAKKSFRKDFL